jgi:stage 0 sporulation regulatory protein
MEERILKRLIIKNILMGKIELKKKDMYRSAKRFGFTDPRVVACSQELDILLNRYQEIMVGNFRISVFTSFCEQRKWGA